MQKIFLHSENPYDVSVISALCSCRETIIQQEEISFEKCLKVITTSESKLSVHLK